MSIYPYVSVCVLCISVGITRSCVTDYVCASICTCGHPSVGTHKGADGQINDRMHLRMDG